MYHSFFIHLSFHGHLGCFHVLAIAAPLWASLVAQVVNNSACSAGDLGSIPELERPHGEGNGNPLQYSYLGNPIDRGAWWARVHGVPESDTTERERDACNMSNTDKQSSISEIY